jgi:hypothetical protein
MSDREAAREALEALRRPLEFVARDGFANLERVRDLGPSLESAAARLADRVAPPPRERLASWARDVRRWDNLPRPERERLVAVGLRLCASAAIELPAVAPAPRPVTREGSAELGAQLLGLPGVGPATAAKLREKGLTTVGDLLHLLPRRWDDLRALVPIALLEAGRPQLTRGAVVRARVIPAYRRRILEVVFADDGATLIARWFHFRGGMLERFRVGARFFVLGTPKPWKQALHVVHPETILDESTDGEAAPAGVRAATPSTSG